MQLKEKNNLKHKLPLGLAVLLLVAFPFVFQRINNYVVYVGAITLLYFISVSGLDVLFGYCGMISMGHAAFYAIGAYGSALLHKYCSVPPILGMVIAAFIAAGIGALLAIPASKLVFHFLSLATMAFNEIIYQLISQSPGGITGNFQGMSPVDYSFFGITLDTHTKFFLFALVMMLIMLTLKNNLIKSKFGRSWMAIRENVHAANGMGINVRNYKVLAFSISAFYTALAGSMFGHLVGYISPDSFTSKQSLMFLTMLLFGGSGTLWGPIVGVLAVEFLNEGMRFAAEYQMLIYGALMLIVILVLPGGLYGTIRDKIVQARRKKHAEA